MILLRLTLALLLFAPWAAAQRPSDEETAQFIEKVRTAALNYQASLPDFLCTQMVHRYEDVRGNNRWLSIDTLTVRLSYSGRVEEYKLAEINGKPTDRDFMEVGGSTSKGEFGTMLYFIFHPQSQAEFRWKGWAHYKKHRVGVYTFHIGRSHSFLTVAHGDLSDGPNTIHPGYHGEIQFDPESGMILRVSQEAELPLSFPIRTSTAVVEYNYTNVGSRRYLLPERAEVLIADRRYRGRNVVDFKDYRKFETETTITFDK